ncbi:hypothetical protein [Streptomyces brasiliensis]|uniref:hypothetical protein n=1 Tax=Streptomyces brasiliensis TaxID=1954 RepID=UPI00166FE6B1|nr:hypothetical protein [Streptomyces brasiliensis]
MKRDAVTVVALSQARSQAERTRGAASTADDILTELRSTPTTSGSTALTDS